MSSKAVTDRQWKLFSNSDKMDHILHRTALSYSFTVSQLTGKRRTNDVSLARHTAMYLCKRKTTSSTTDIGRKFGNRTHGTVIHACKGIVDLLDNKDPGHDKITELELSLFNTVDDPEDWLAKIDEEDHYLVELAHSMEMTSCDRAAYLINKYGLENTDDRAKAMQLVRRLLGVVERITK